MYARVFLRAFADFMNRSKSDLKCQQVTSVSVPVSPANGACSHELDK